MSKYEQYKDQYISKYDILTALWEQQKYGSAQDSKGRAKAITFLLVSWLHLMISFVYGRKMFNAV